MTRFLLDSTTAADVPAHAEMVAGYVDGRYANVDELRARFPRAQLVTITVTGRPGAHVVDCEPGDLTPSHAAAWAARELNAGRRPTIYCPASLWSTVRYETRRLGIAGKVSWWVADYDGDPTIPAGAVAKQYADPDTARRMKVPHHDGGHYDVSVVADHWPGVDPESHQPTDLSRGARRWAGKLQRRLSHRHRPLSPVARAQLLALRRQLDRVLGLKP